MKLLTVCQCIYGGDRYDLDDTEEFIPNAQDEMESMTCTQRRLDGGHNRSVNTVTSSPMCPTVSKGYDLDDTEEFIPNAQDEMESMTCTQRHLDGGDNRSVNTVTSGPICPTVSKGTRGEVDEFSDTSRTDMVELHDTDGQLESDVCDDLKPSGVDLPEGIRRVSLEMLFPPWTVTRHLYEESLSAKHSGISNDVLLFSELGMSLVHHYRVHRSGRPHIMFRGKYLAQLRTLLPLIAPTAGGPSGTACPPVASTTSRTDGLDATPQPPRRRRRQQVQFRDMPDQIAPRLTEQDPLMAAGAVVFDCRPALLPVSVNVSGIDMRAARSAISLAESVLVLPNLSSNSGGGGADLFDYIGPELVVPDSGTDLEDELLSPDGSPMAISHGVSRLPERLEEDVDLAQILAEFGTLPAIVTPIHDPQETRVMPPAEYRPPKGLVDVLVMPAGPADDDERPLTGSVGCSPGAPAAPAVPTLERNLMFPGQTLIGPPSGGATADYQMLTVPLPSRLATVCKPVDELETLRERVHVPDLSCESQSDAPPRLCQDSQGCLFCITSYDLEIDGSDFSPEYGVQLHDPRLLEYVGAPESARLLSRSPEYWVQHMRRGKTLSAALQLKT